MTPTRERFLVTGRNGTLFAILSLLMAVQGAFARTYYVSPDGNAEGGASWATAYQTVVEGVIASDPGDMVWIRYGNYDESVTIEKPISMIGGFIGTETEENAAVTHAYSGGTVISARTKQLPGLMIGSSCTIQRISIQDCKTAGITVYNNSHPVVQDVTVSGNTSPTVGGGFAITSSSPEITDCTITGNSANHGGGLTITDNSNVLIRNCLISNNTATLPGGQGGGISCGRSILVVDNCNIIVNMAITGSDFESRGGGIKSGLATILLNNTIINGNNAQLGSQIDSFRDISFVINNCTIISQSGGILFWDWNQPSFLSSIIWGGNGIIPPGLEVLHSCVQGGYPGEGNISVDPKFRDAAQGNYRLQPDSPSIDTAAMTGPPDDLDGKPRPVDIAGIGRDGTATYDMGAYEFQLEDLPIPTPTPTPSQVDPGKTILYK